MKQVLSSSLAMAYLQQFHSDWPGSKCCFCCSSANDRPNIAGDPEDLSLSQSTNEIVVYFDSSEPMERASVRTRVFINSLRSMRLLLRSRGLWLLQLQRIRQQQIVFPSVCSN